MKLQELIQNTLKYSPDKASIKELKTWQPKTTIQDVSMATGHRITKEILEEIESLTMENRIQEAFLNKDKEQLKYLEEMKCVLKETKKYSYFK